MECERCHREIPEGEEMWEKLKGRYVPTHRDCHKGYEFGGGSRDKTIGGQSAKALRSHQGAG